MAATFVVSAAQPTKLKPAITTGHVVAARSPLNRRETLWTGAKILALCPFCKRLIFGFITSLQRVPGPIAFETDRGTARCTRGPLAPLYQRFIECTSKHIPKHPGCCEERQLSIDGMSIEYRQRNFDRQRVDTGGGVIRIEAKRPVESGDLVEDDAEDHSKTGAA
eukprot:SAG31_NODE_5428_length_2544_cov_2.005317_1_plen_164_part_10